MGFIEEYYIKPLLGNGFFNPVNTITYGIILIIGFYLVYRLLAKVNIKTDSRLMLAILPFIFFASATRALRDFIYNGLDPASLPEGFLENIAVNYSHVAGQAYNYIINIIPFKPVAWSLSWMTALFPTPGSYLITFVIALATLLISLAVQRAAKIQYWKVMFLLGVVYSLIIGVLLPVTFIDPLYIVIPVFLGWTAVILLSNRIVSTNRFAKRFSNNFFTKALTTENCGILLAHMLDATATFTALTFFGFIEQHVVPRLFIPLLGPASIFLLKLAVIIPVLYYIDQYKGDENFKSLMKIAILILGLAPGLRDIITLLLVGG